MSFSLFLYLHRLSHGVIQYEATEICIRYTKDWGLYRIYLWLGNPESLGNHGSALKTEEKSKCMNLAEL